MNNELMPNKSQLGKKNLKKLRRGLIGAVLAGTILFTMTTGVMGSNDAGFYKIKQGRVNGKLTVINNAGIHMKNFGKETQYALSDTYYFSKSDLDGGSGAESQAIKVRFVGGGTAFIDGSVKFRLPVSEEKRKALHLDFRSYEAVVQDLIRQYTAQVLKNTATLMKAEDTYAGRKGEFNQLFEEQLRKGIYKTKTLQVKKQDAEGNDLLETIVEIVKDSKGSPVIAVSSPFGKYGVELMQVSIKDIDYDDKIDTLISQKQEAEQRKILARAEAERAKQDAITAEMEGKARVAKAEADENVEKIKEVTKALKNKEVAILKAEQEKQVAELYRERAELEAKALIVKKEAEAKANKLLVEAGLTPKEKAEIDMKTKIGVAEQLSKVNVPKIIIGGTEKGSSPMDAISINMMLDIIEKLDESDKK